MDIIFLLDQHERTIGHLSNDAPQACPYYNDKWSQDLDTGASTYEFYVPADHEGAGSITKEGYIIRRDFAGDLMQFQITRLEEVHEDGILYKYVFCEFAWAELNGEIVRPYDLPGTDAATALRFALAGTRWEPGKVEFFGTADISSSNYDTSLKMAHDIKDAFDGEIKFRVTMKNNEITGRYVDLLERVGGNEGKIIAFEKNLTSAKRIHDRTTVATALIGVGKGDSSGDQVTFTAEVWSKAAGNPQDKPAGQDWIGDDEALKNWGIDGRHIMQVFEYNTTSPVILLSKTWEELQRRKNGLLQYEASAALLDRYGWDWEQSNIGDTILIQDHFFTPALMVNARIIKLERSFTNPLEQNATFGDYEAAISNASALADIQSTLLKRETQWSEAAQGAANIVRSETAPEETENTIWVQPAAGTRPFDLIRTYNPASGLWEVTAPLNPGDIGAEGEIVRSIVAPPNPFDGQIWADTSSVPNILKRWDAAANTWQPMAPTTAGEIGAEQAIIKATTAPPHLEGRLWLDTSKTPNIIYRSTGGTWVKTAPTLPGEVGAEQAIYKQATAPAHLNGRIWIDTSSVPNKQFRSTGSAWINITPTKPGDVGADAAGAAAAAKSEAIAAAAADATSKANAAQTAAENLARSEAAAAQTNAEAHADGIVDAEEQARIDQAAANLAAAKADATSKANAAEAAAKAASEAAIWKQASAPAHLEGRLWLDTSLTPNVLKRSAGGVWVNASPTDAADIGAETAAGSASKAKIAEYLAINSAVQNDNEELTQRSQAVLDKSSYYTQSLIVRMDAARQDLWNAAANYNWAVGEYRADEVITPAEESTLATYLDTYRLAAAALGKIIQEATQDAGGILVGTITGITLQVANAGISNVGTLSSETRIWAGQSFSNRASAPFRVTQAGAVYASNITITGGSINIANNATVGNALYLGSTGDYTSKFIYFNGYTNISASDTNFSITTGTFTLQDSQDVIMQTDNGSVYMGGNFYEFMAFTRFDYDVEVYGALRSKGAGLSINDLNGYGSTLYATSGSGGHFVTNQPEYGFCGIQVEAYASTNYYIGMGIGVNFKVTKDYTPSSISMSRQSGNLTNAQIFVGYIGNYGFWLQVLKANATSNSAWRGTYYA